jgi:hypothetical protein
VLRRTLNYRRCRLSAHACTLYSTVAARQLGSCRSGTVLMLAGSGNGDILKGRAGRMCTGLACIWLPALGMGMAGGRGTHSACMVLHCEC